MFYSFLFLQTEETFPRNVLTWPIVQHLDFIKHCSTFISFHRFFFIRNYPDFCLKREFLLVFHGIYFRFIHTQTQNVNLTSIKLPFRVSNIIMHHKFDEPKVNKDINGQWYVHGFNTSFWNEHHCKWITEILHNFRSHIVTKATHCGMF